MIKLNIFKNGITIWHKLNNSSLHIDVYGYTKWSIRSWYYHNNNGPCNILRYKTEWYVNHTRHRLDGPAIEWLDGDKWWYIDGEEYRTELEYWLAVQNYDKT